jgi:hypothetical protein
MQNAEPGAAYEPGKHGEHMSVAPVLNVFAGHITSAVFNSFVL